MRAEGVVRGVVSRPSRGVRSGWMLASVWFGVSAWLPAAQGSVPTLAASMDCRSEPGSGRLLCTVELVPQAGQALRWSDVLVVSSPPAAQPLRARVTSASQEPGRIVVGFVLGNGPGGPIEVLARAVSCPATLGVGACRSLQARVAYTLVSPGG